MSSSSLEEGSGLIVLNAFKWGDLTPPPQKKKKKHLKGAPWDQVGVFMGQVKPG